MTGSEKQYDLGKWGDYRIRLADVGDAEGILAIYAPYVRDTAITFELAVPGLDEMRGRISSIMDRYPCLVAEKEGEIAGYAYAHEVRERAAFSHSAEMTIYLSDRPGVRGGGLGRALYGLLEGELKLMGITNLYAAVAVPEKEDPFLTEASWHFHEHVGYQMVGKMDRCGTKFGRWYHLFWLEKLIGDHMADPKPVIRYPDIKHQRD